MIKGGIFIAVVVGLTNGAYAQFPDAPAKSKQATVTHTASESFSFAAVPITDYVKLNWTTVNEVNNNFFTVERSADYLNFESIKRVNGVVKNATTANYEAFDYAPIKGVSYYRLRLTDFDGKQTFSNVVDVAFPSPGSLTLVHNAKSGNYILDFKTSKQTEDNYTIEILNPLGESVFKVELNAFTGRYNREIDLMSIGKSTYMVSITTSTDKIIKRVIAY